MRGTSTKLLPLAIAVVLPFTFLDTLLLRAEICVPENFYDGSLLHYSICNVPDLDQLREDDAFVAGLPNGGKMYCAPTSAMNWMAYIANHGYPSLLPGPGSWGPEDDYLKPQYQAMTEFLLSMGELMGTHPTDGTTGGMKIGMEVWLNSLYSSGDFVVSKYHANGWYAPLFIHMAKAAVDGALVTPGIGWYVPWSDAPPEIKDVMLQLLGTLPKGYYRDGGHVVTMVSARNDFQFQQIGLHDPATPNGGSAISQSAFATDVYHVIEQTDTFNGSKRTQSRIENIGSNAFMDGYVTIKAKYGLTANQNTLLLFRPILLAHDGLPTKPVVQSFSSIARRNIVDLAVHPERTTHPYLVEGDNTIWQIDALTGESTRFATVGNPTALTFGGPQQYLYVLLPNHIVAFDVDGRQQARVLLPEPLTDIAYDSSRSRLVGVAERGDKVFLFDDSLAPLDSVAFEARFCSGDTSAATDARTGAVWLLCKGETVLTRLVMGDVRLAEKGVEVSVIALEGAQNPTAITLDDTGHVFVSDGGLMAEYATNGRRVVGSRFTGLPAGQHVDVLRSFSNFDPRTMNDIRFRNVLPVDARR
jgi:hypothetical protein